MWHVDTPVWLNDMELQFWTGDPKGTWQTPLHKAYSRPLWTPAPWGVPPPPSPFSMCQYYTGNNGQIHTQLIFVEKRKLKFMLRHAKKLLNHTHNSEALLGREASSQHISHAIVLVFKTLHGYPNVIPVFISPSSCRTIKRLRLLTHNLDDMWEWHFQEH
jgi:hypothetical protein